ncbi:MAG: GNAT family N-acetyltransferase [Pirellulales bacterium]
MSDVPSMSLTIGAATLGDLDDAAELFDAYRQFYGQAAAYDAGRAFLQQRLERGESVILIARREPEAVGFVQLYPLFSSVSMQRIWLLNDLYVSESARRTGVGTALLDAACEHGARTGGRLRLELATATTNTAAQQVYASNGWTRDDVFMHFQRNM